MVLGRRQVGFGSGSGAGQLNNGGGNVARGGRETLGRVGAFEAPGQAADATGQGRGGGATVDDGENVGFGCTMPISWSRREKSPVITSWSEVSV
jgi:hypothetical protein